MTEQKLLHLLQKKKGFFEAIHDLTEQESTLPVDQLLSNLEQKQILLTCIDEVDEELEHFKETLHIISQEVSEELDEIKQVIAKILHLDSHNQESRKREFCRERPTRT